MKFQTHCYQLRTENQGKKWRYGNHHKHTHRETARRSLFSYFRRYSGTCVAQGRTISETLEIARDVAKKLLEASQEKEKKEIHVQESFDYPLVVGL